MVMFVFPVEAVLLELGQAERWEAQPGLSLEKASETVSSWAFVVIPQVAS